MSKHRAPGPAVLVPSSGYEGAHCNWRFTGREVMNRDYGLMRANLADEIQREADRVAGERARRLVESMDWRANLAPARSLNIPRQRGGAS